MEFGSHRDEVILEPNSEYHYSLKSDDTYLVDIDLVTTNPTSGKEAIFLLFIQFPRRLRQSFQPFQLSCSGMEILP